MWIHESAFKYCESFSKFRIKKKKVKVCELQFFFFKFRYNQKDLD